MKVLGLDNTYSCDMRDLDITCSEMRSAFKTYFYITTIWSKQQFQK